jgi:putative Mg2+ transporter-C (MgtC) family protein
MTELSYKDMFLRLLMAFLAGAAIGWERESHGRPAGLRTNILACVASAVAMIISQILFVESAAATATGSWRPDPARLGAGILTGIGFLGAGTIMRHANFVRGVTTAASLWFVTVLGLAFGSGQIALGLIGTGIAMMTLFALPRFEKHIRTDWYSTITVALGLDAMPEEELRKRIEALGLLVKSIKLNHDFDKKQRTIIYEVKLRKTEVFEKSNRAVSELAKLPGVLQVRWI